MKLYCIHTITSLLLCLFFMQSSASSNCVSTQIEDSPINTITSSSSSAHVQASSDTSTQKQHSAAPIPPLSSDSSEMHLPAIIRMARVCAGVSGNLPPVLLVNMRDNNLNPVYGETSVRLEVDVQAAVPPVFRVLLVHCRADWTEDNNVFLNEINFLRSSQLNWTPAPPSSRYYNYRGTMSLPNVSLRINYGGNWKVKILDEDNDSLVLAETRFFAIDCAVDCSLEIGADFYEPTHKASPAALNLDCRINGSLVMSDINLNTAVFYRLNRWYEPFAATGSSSLNFNASFGNRYSASVSGIVGAGKRFLVRPIPAENEYRVLDLLNLGWYPASSTPIRIPLADIPRKGTSLQTADDGAMVTYGLSDYDDSYVPVEFVLDPTGPPSTEDVYLIGSFNNWKTSQEWQMSWIAEERQYKLRHWVRRGRHNYYYGTGHLNADTREVEGLNFEEFEGNNVAGGMTFVCFVYYRDNNFGGYDNIVGVCAASIFGPRRR